MGCYPNVRKGRTTLALMALGMALAVGPLAGQTGSVTGRVTDASTMRPLEGAQVSITALRVGSLAGTNGRFLLPAVPAGTHTLEIRYIGYRPVTRQITVTAGQALAVDVPLETQAIALDELVVTGTGVVTERRQLGATVASVTGEQMDKMPISNVSSSLMGRVSGFAPAGPSEFGSAPLMTIRGGVSLTQRNQPLVYIDGVRVDNTFNFVGNARAGQSLDHLNPRDVERVEVIKGAAAATLYGTEASAGVIQIITKRGTASAPAWTFEIGQEGSKVPVGRAPKNWGYDFGTKTLVGPSDPLKDYLGPWGLAQDYSVSVRGGSNRITYFSSARLFDEKGPMDREVSLFGSKSIRTNLTIQATDRLKARTDINLVRGIQKNPGGNGDGVAGNTSSSFWVFWLAVPTTAVPEYPYGGRYASLYGYLYWPPPGGYSGPVPHDKLPYPVDGPPIFPRKSKLETDRLTLSGAFTYDWGGGISSEFIVGRDETEFENIEHGLKGHDRTLPEGYRLIRNDKRRETTLDLKTSWQYKLNPSLTSTLLVGGQSFREQTWNRSYGTRNFSAAELGTLRGGATVLTSDEASAEVINAGVYAQEQVALSDRLFLTGAARLDGNSAFGKDFGFQIYPKVGASWVVSDHEFWPFQKWDQFRLRAALGAAGLQPGAFDAQQTWQPVSFVDNVAGVMPLNSGNPDLKPERTVEREVGAELGFGRGRAGLEVVYFNSKTTDALLPAPNTPSLGFRTTQLRNLGGLRKQGLETSLNVTWMRRGDFRFATNLQTTWTDVKVTSTGGLPGYRIQSGRYYHTIREGYSPGAWIGPTQDPAKPYSISVPIEKLTRLNQISPNFLKNAAGGDSLTYGGNSIPSVTASFSPSLDLPGGLRVNALLSAALGFYTFTIVQQTRMNVRNDEQTARFEQLLDDPSTSTAERQRIADYWGSHHPANLSNLIEDGDHARFQELSLSYTIPESLVRALRTGSMDVSLSARNLALWQKCKHCVGDPFAGQVQRDPDESPGTAFVQNTDYGAPPTARRFGVRIRATF